MPDEPRRFTKRQRAALFLLADGRCAICGVMLPAGWHADHEQPHSHGGATSVKNGQALCPSCNRKKGAFMQGVHRWPLEKVLRVWQQQALAQWQRHNLTDFMLVATPGAGKTLFALRVASIALTEGLVERIVIVVPTDHLRGQWADAAATVGLDVNPEWDNASNDGPEMCGIVVTYHQVARQPDVHAKLCRVRTLVIFDEVHHAGDGNTWGDMIRFAYGGASRRLLLSGTPFRSDNAPIPFVTYQDGRSLADFIYGYGEALTDDVCRAVHFPNYEGTIEWMSWGAVYRKAFRDEVPQPEAARRLKTALEPGGAWLAAIIREANDRLTEVRYNGHMVAGGLVVTIDQWHARQVADLVRRITGEEPVVAVSDDPDASDKIKAFATGGQRWLVAVRMVSEGVDIPRLRVGVYATNIITEMYFRQLVGRFVRVIADFEPGEQSAWVYLPADDTLVSYAHAIKEERDHQLEEVAREDQKARERSAHGESFFGDYEPIDADDARLQSIILDQTAYEGPEVEIAKGLRIQLGFTNMSDPQVAAILRAHLKMLGLDQARPEAPPTEAPSPRPKYERRRRLRTLAARKVAKLAAITKREHAAINRDLATATGSYTKEATEEQLQLRVDILDRWLKEAGDDRGAESARSER